MYSSLRDAYDDTRYDNDEDVKKLKSGLPGFMAKHRVGSVLGGMAFGAGINHLSRKVYEKISKKPCKPDLADIATPFVDGLALGAIAQAQRYRIKKAIEKARLKDNKLN
jgi:hypothetical protein